jgi:hypothetical protein
MRFPRVKADGQAFYHCFSRVVEGRFIQSDARVLPKTDSLFALRERLGLLPSCELVAQ